MSGPAIIIDTEVTMINPLGSMRPEDEGYPSGFALSFSKLADLATFGTDWRQYVPFGLADAPTGPLSYKLGNVVEETFPPLQRYDEYLEQTGATGTSMPDAFRNMYDFAFNTTSTVLGELTCPTSAIILVVLVLIFRLVKSMLLPLFSSIGRKTGRASHGVEWEKNNEERIVKFGEYVFRLLYHSAVSMYGVWYFWDKPWWDPSQGGTKTLFLDHPRQPIEPGMAWYYLVQSAYNIEAMIELLRMSFDVRLQSPIFQTKEGNTSIQSPIRIGWSKTCRGDFREMFIHHLVTNLLIIGSSGWRFTRIGSMVFLVHDISDVPVDLSKLANFVKWKRTTIICFLTMVLVWLVTRLLILPFVIYRAVLFESYILVSVGGLDPLYYYAYRPFFFTLIGLIILLHLVWFTMFIRMGWLLVSKGEAHDLSEHKKGEEQPRKQQAATNGTSAKQKSS